MIYFFCGCCGKKFGISEGLVGRQGLCRDCGTMFTVPAESQSEPFQGQPEAVAPEPVEAEEPQESRESTSARMMQESPEWGGEEAPAERTAPPVPPAAPPKRRATSVIHDLPTTMSRRQETAIVPAPPPAAPAKRPPSSIAPAAPPAPRSPQRQSSAQRRAVEQEKSIPRGKLTGPAERQKPADGPRRGPGRAVASVLVVCLLGAVGYVWKTGGFAPGEGAGPSHAGGSANDGPKVSDAGTGEAAEPTPPPPTEPSNEDPAPPAPPPTEPPKEDPAPPSPPPTEPPKEDPAPPTPPPTEPPKEDPAPPSPPPTEPPKEDPAPPTPPPTEPPKEDPTPPSPPPTEPPKEDPTPPPISLTDPPKEDPQPPTPPPTEPPKADPPVEPPPPAEGVAAALKAAQSRLAAARGGQDLSQQTHALDPLQGVLKAREVTQFLGKLLLASQEMPAVRQRAAELLGDGGQPDAVSILERGIKAAHNLDTVARAAIAALGRIDDPASPRKLDALVRSRLVPAEDPLDNVYAIDAVLALGKVKRFRNIETLMALYLTLAQLYPGEVQGQTEEDRRKEEYRRMLEDATRSALGEISGKSFTSYQEWSDWWQANRGNYK